LFVGCVGASSYRCGLSGVAHLNKHTLFLVAPPNSSMSRVCAGMVAGLLLLDPGLALPSGAPVADLPASTDARACGLGNCRHSPLHTPCCLWLVADWAASVASGQRQHRVSGSGGATVLSYTRLVCGCVRVGHFIASRLPKVSDGRHTDKGTDKGTSWSCRCRQAPLPPRRAAISCSYMVLLGAGAAWCLLWTCCFVCLLLYPLLLVPGGTWKKVPGPHRQKLHPGALDPPSPPSPP
jgi:hypothetical protein